MIPQEKKEHIQKWIDEGDKRSWNELAADLELQLWHKRYNIVSSIEPNNYVEEIKKES